MARKLRIPVIIIVILTVMIGSSLRAILHDRDETIARQYELLRDMVNIVAEQGHHTIHDTKTALDQIADMIGRAGGLAQIRDRDHWAEMRRAAAFVTGGLSVFVFDADGNPVMETAHFPARPLNVADREYFLAAKRGEPLYIGPAIDARTGGGIVFTISRPLHDANGRFIGAVAVALDTKYLARALDMMNFGLMPAVGIFRQDGGIVTRVPNMEKLIGGSIAEGALIRRELPKAPSGTYLSDSTLDGGKRLAAYTTMEDYGLVAYAGIELSVTLAPWWDRAITKGLETTAGILVVLLALFWGLRSQSAAARVKAELLEAVTATEQINGELQQARRDPLTGLPGRALLLERIEEQEQSRRAKGFAMAFLYIDLDGFKSVNDRFGHAGGDDILMRAAHALQSPLRDGDLAGRLGGDEFAICVAASPTLIEGIATTMAKHVVSEIGLLGYGIGCSVGIAITPGSCGDVACMIRHADEAMYEAKRAGKGQFRLYDNRKQDRACPSCAQLSAAAQKP
jgi:diguanylate cyclase (GGDEF)-like protein